MHIPEGFLNNQTSLSLIGASLLIGGYAMKKVKHLFWETSRVLVPQLLTNAGLDISSPQSIAKLNWKKSANQVVQKMALVAAFVFAAQTVNFPVANGTSGHLLGGVLAAIVLGPWAGMLVISAVLVIQSLVFADGGVIALGANIFNMAIGGAVGGYYFYQLGLKLFKNKNLAIISASWLSVLLAAILCALELAFSKTVSLNLVLPAMVSVHALIGIGEAIITILAVKFLFTDKGENYEPKE